MGKDGKKETVTVTIPIDRSLGKDGICRMEAALSRKLFGAPVRAIDRLEF